MKRLLIILSGLFALLLSSPPVHAAPTSMQQKFVQAAQPAHAATRAGWKQLGRMQGALIRLNPFLPKQRIAKSLTQVATYQTGRALRAFMVGNMPLGMSREAHASYLEGLAEGMR